MATVYKIEVEVVSHWCSYTPTDLGLRIKELLNKEFEKEQSSTPNEIEVTEFDIKKLK